MGTNYYLKLKDEPELHIGKSSAGWVFSLHVYPGINIISLYDWIPLMLTPDSVIRDEYYREITVEEMLNTIMMRGRDTAPQWSDSDWALNQAQPGPNNLVRGRQSGELGRGRTHGEGTWDYCDYEFC